MHIGINYLVEKTHQNKFNNAYDDIYDILIKYNYIDLLKFPGKYCTVEELTYFINFAQNHSTYVDIHGLPGMFPATHDIHFCSNIKLEQIPKSLWDLKHNSRISTHIGLRNHDRLQNYSSENLNQIFYSNLKKLKELLFNQTSFNFEIGGELQPGGFDFDKETLSADFIGNIWNEMDFGIFDIAHAKLICKDLGISLSSYIHNFQHKDKVKIIHISGNTDTNGQYLNKPDKHILTTLDEFYELESIIKSFKNVDSIISEYAYPSSFSTNKEICIEAISLFYTINHISNLKTIREILISDLNETASNLELILSKLEK